MVLEHHLEPTVRAVLEGVVQHSRPVRAAEDVRVIDRIAEHDVGVMPTLMDDTKSRLFPMDAIAGFRIHYTTRRDRGVCDVHVRFDQTVRVEHPVLVPAPKNPFGGAIQDTPDCVAEVRDVLPWLVFVDEGGPRLFGAVHDTCHVLYHLDGQIIEERVPLGWRFVRAHDSNSL